jgi:cytochrome oxidase Cu insertion factor (SCO1/SenC/PrrC family)
MNENKPRRGSRTVIVVLILLFAAPLLAAWLLYFLGIHRAGAASHGELITPPRPLPDVMLIDPMASPQDADEHLHGKWTLLYVHPGECETDCAGYLYRMRQIRLVLGQNAHRLQRVWITDVNGRNLRSQLEEYRGQLVLDLDGPGSRLIEALKISPADNPLQSGHLYLIDPLGNLLMRYSPATDPGGIIKDLRRLMKYSRIG